MEKGHRWWHKQMDLTLCKSHTRLYEDRKFKSHFRFSKLPAFTQQFGRFLSAEDDRHCKSAGVDKFEPTFIRSTKTKICRQLSHQPWWHYDSQSWWHYDGQSWWHLDHQSWWQFGSLTFGSAMTCWHQDRFITIFDERVLAHCLENNSKNNNNYTTTVSIE